MKNRPFLKWAGGKRKLLPYILALFPEDYKDRVYHEPFIGGGALFYEVRPKQGSINDINRQLMTFYRVVRNNPDELIEEAKKYAYNKETYYRIRSKFNGSDLSEIEESALFLYLNKASYNGMYRVNAKGEFNSAFGRFSNPLRNPIIVPEERILHLSSLLENIKIFNGDFSYIEKYSKNEDLVYFDPPYQPISSTAKFTSYSAAGFSIKDQERLRDICLKLDKKGVIFVLSNSYEKSLMELYRDTDFKIYTIQAYRCIGSSNISRTKINEILITNTNI